jgi:hypothetical protein
MTWVLRINHVLIVLFALQSGLFKVAGAITRRGDPGAWWEADNHLFAHMGMSVWMVGVFGAIQASAGAGLLLRRTVMPAAMVVAACNALATVGLFVAGIQPFGMISILFVFMALAELKRIPATAIASPPKGT